MSHHRTLPRVLTALAAASLLAACQGGSAGAPPAPQAASNVPQSAGQAAQSAARSTSKHRAKAPAISASPASLEFTAGQVAAGTAQTVTISALEHGKLAISIAGTGNCPAVTPATLALESAGGDDDRDRHDGANAATGAITVTPAGAGPAACTITVSGSAGHGDDGDHHDGDRHDNNDGDHHDGDNDGGANVALLTIPVVVDAPPTPTPMPTPTPRTTR